MNPKKLLAILGSSHTTGITSSMLNHAICSTEKAGYEVTKKICMKSRLDIARDVGLVYISEIAYSRMICRKLFVC